MSIEGEELPPSKLGTKDHWDEVYEFGESSVNKMRSWVYKNLAALSFTSSPIRILECGSGNGTLLLSFLTTPSPTPLNLHLTGIDYSEKATVLSRSIEQSRRAELEDEEDDTVNECEVEWKVGDLLCDEVTEQWDIVLDKGTFDALCLSSDPVVGDGRLPSRVYPEKISRMVKDGGVFLITSCNFTEEEIKSRFTADLAPNYDTHDRHQLLGTPSVILLWGQKGYDSLHGCIPEAPFSRIPIDRPQLDRIERNPLTIYLPNTGRDRGSCGGTKTDVAIASASGRVMARASGGTSNMAEVGLQLSFERITSTVLDAVSALPPFYRSKPAYIQNGGPRTCPIHFANVWVGISGCDTALDQSQMSDLLSPFFSRESTPILNDANLLGGPLLTHQCPWGIAVIAGTGSVNVLLEVTKDGEVKQTGRRGGLGYLLGDEGSAYDLGRNAIIAAVNDFHEGSEVAGGLAEKFRNHFKVAQTSEILAKVYELDPALSPANSTNDRKLRISALSLPILQSFTSSSPDPIAERATMQSARSLAKQIISLTREATKKGKKVEDAALVFGGGVIRQKAYRDVVERLLEEAGLRFGRTEVVEDVAGAGALGLVQKWKRS
ncbi:EEF1A lysine methyltransferase 2, partial [Tremellales sp. Uapishka_1]